MYVRLASCCQQWLASLYFYRSAYFGDIHLNAKTCLKPGQPLRGAHWTYVLVTNLIFFKFMVKRVVFWCCYYYWQTFSLLTPYCTNFFLVKKTHLCLCQKCRNKSVFQRNSWLLFHEQKLLCIIYDTPCSYRYIL